MSKNVIITIACGLMLLTGIGVSHNIWIKCHELPLVIDTYGRFQQNRSIFMWTPFDSMRTHWDLTQFQTGYFARVGLRDYTEGRPPAPDSMEDDPPDPEVCEMDTMGSGSEQWVYLYKTSVGLWMDGLDFSQQSYRFIGNYRPDQYVYCTPMYDGAGWNTQIQWRWEMLPGIFVIFTEQHQKRIVAKGKVKVPMSGDYYWPCLVIRDHMHFSDNMGGTPEDRWIYEWVVPGHFLGANGVGAAMGQNGASPDFLNVEQCFQMERCSIPGWDLTPPEFANTTVWPDTDYAGPFQITSTITDNDAVGAESLFYRLDEGTWQAVGADSSTGDDYHFTIPQVDDPVRVDYYVWAMDDFSVTDSIEFWTTWPVCSPESTMVTFIVDQVGVEAGPKPVIACRFTAEPNPFTRSTRLRLIPSALRHADARIYAIDGQLVRTLTLYPSGGALEAHWDGLGFKGQRLPAGSYLYQVDAGDRTLSGRLTFNR